MGSRLARLSCLALAGCVLLGCSGQKASGQGEAEPPEPTFIPPPSMSPGGDRGISLGRFVNTFYWMEFESDYSGPADTSLVGPDCRELAKVPEEFADRICVEGSGRLTSGSLLNLSGECRCGYACPETGSSVCFFPVTDQRATWGFGSDGNALVPLRSLAIQESVVPHGTTLYIPEWDGITIPSSAQGLGGFVHDGCFRVDDIGYGVEGRHYDLYAGTAVLWMRLEDLFPTDSSSTLYRDPPRCAGKLP